MSYSVESVLQDESVIANFPWDRDVLIDFARSMAQYGRSHALPLAIAVYMNDVKIYQEFLDGTSEVNELWIQRKINTVRACGHSTLYARAVMDKSAYDELKLEHHFGELAICGGGIPIIKNGKQEAVVIVSGLPHEDDHNLIVNQFDIFRSKYGK